MLSCEAPMLTFFTGKSSKIFLSRFPVEIIAHKQAIRKKCKVLIYCTVHAAIGKYDVIKTASRFVEVWSSMKAKETVYAFFYVIS